jgi:RNA polymerase sigma-70 factor (ECF subfamily)
MAHCRNLELAPTVPDRELADDRDASAECYTLRTLQKWPMSNAVDIASDTTVAPRKLEVAAAIPGDALEAVMSRLRSRDPDALADLYDATVGKVLALARAILRNHADAEELVCEVYERAWTRAGSFDGSRGTALAWLLAMCRSQALDQLRRRRAQSRTREAFGRDPAEDSVAGPEDSLDCFQRGHAVHAALAALAPERRQMIAMAFFAGLSHQEISTELEMPLGTVKSHLRRGLLELRERLGSVGVGHED